MKPTRMGWLGDHVVIVSTDGKTYHNIGRVGRKLPIPKTSDGAPLVLVPIPSRADLIAWQENAAVAEMAKNK